MSELAKKVNLCVIGSGGTGTYFLKEFSRYSYGGDSRFKNMIIIDGDTVEEKNLERQSFSEEDIGFNKAAVMADVLNQSFGTSWMSVGEYLTSIEQLEQIVGMAEQTPVILIGCVDNHACRLVLEEYFNTHKNVAYYDSANEFETGEVVFAYKANGKVLSPCRSYYFPDIKEGDIRAVTEMSCEELNNVAPQHIKTNMAAGNILLSELCSFMSSNNGEGTYGFVTFDTSSYYQELTLFNEVGSKRAVA